MADDCGLILSIIFLQKDATLLSVVGLDRNFESGPRTITVIGLLKTMCPMFPPQDILDELC